MPTSDAVVDTRFAKRLIIANALVPGALLLWDAYHHQLGVNDVNFAIRTTGLLGLIGITASLAITPIRALTGWSKLIAIRRELGVFGFFYISAHFLIFFLFDRQASVSSTLSEIGKRTYLWYGTSALVLMAPLALTSTDGMVTRLGPRAWKRLHRLAYVIAIAGVVHYYLLVKSDVRIPLAFAGVVGVLLAFRLGAHYVHLRTLARRAQARPAAAAPARKRAFWSGDLTIARIFDETPDVKTFRFVSPDGGPLPFTHVAGQYLNLALTIDGRRVARSYTIASSPTRSAYCEISVKRTKDGYASQHLHDTWREGDRVRVSAPAGKFVFAGHEATRVVLLAGGIGITPMMAVLRSLTDRGWRGDIYLLFSVRVVADIVFRDELAYLQSRFANLHVRIVVSRDPETPWDGLRGQITRDVIADFVPGLAHGPVLLCGPAPMMTAMREILVGMGVPDADVWQEAFVSPPAARADDAEAADETDEALPDGALASVSFARSGKVASCGSDQSLLDVAEDIGVDLPYECRSGVCGQCKTRLLSGRVRMDVQDALSAADRANGFILACQAHVLRDIEVDA
jgi:ferredoxin-NADP reductase/DMSO/TMAO reductase YedYZ heme-binding membrane subunit